MATLRIPTAQLLGILAAIVGVAMYAAKIEARATDAQSKAVELKTDLAEIRRDLQQQRITLATVKADGRAVLKTLSAIERRRGRRSR